MPRFPSSPLRPVSSRRHWSSHGSLQLVLSGDPGATYFVHSPTNLVNWQPFTNLTLINGTFSFNAGWTTNGSALYFRARSGP